MGHLGRLPIGPANSFRFNQAFQDPHVAFLVSRLIHRRFSDKGAMGKALVIQQPPERLDPNLPLADVLQFVGIRTHTLWTRNY